MYLFIWSGVFSQTSEFNKKIEKLQLVSVQGNELHDYNLADRAKDKIIVLEFWETWCGPCIQAMAHLNQLKTAYPNDLLVVCVASESLPLVKNFIAAKSYPFDFVFDSAQQLKSIFPHRGIPHTVIVDKSGNVQSQTLPNFFTEKEVEKLLHGNAIDLPEKRNTNQTQNKYDGEKLLKFELSNSGLDDAPEVKTSIYESKKKIIKNYWDNVVVDTVETIKEYVCKAQNILQLYQLAYSGVSKYRFVFPKELNYIDSNTLSNTYNLFFSSSNLFGNFDDLFLMQLNAIFGLQTEKRIVDTTVLVIKDIKVSSNNIIRKDGNNSDQYVSFMIQDSIAIEGYISSEKLANLIEGRLKQRVELNKLLEKNYYETNIHLKSEKHTTDEWIALLNKEGIYIEKEREKVEYISISKK